MCEAVIRMNVLFLRFFPSSTGTWLQFVAKSSAARSAGLQCQFAILTSFEIASPGGVVYCSGTNIRMDTIG